MPKPVQHTMPRVGPRQDDWWRGAVIYQIYPRSFLDTNGDGVGDLPGITRQLDYVAGLGVDAVWIAPFFPSPMKDYGYDVADYCNVDPLFGTLHDFDTLLQAAHQRRLKIIIDFVPSHTSNQHPWFLESRASRDNARADWYVWADAKEDGSPPNNWQAVFGGPCWTWEPRRSQYYLHNFLLEQPDLNFHNRAVVEALLAQAEFWLQRGVDGFRVDAIDFGVHDLRLRDNPPRPRSQRQQPTGAGAISPYRFQMQLYNKARPELSDLFLKPLFALTERFGGRVLLGEISGDRALERAAEYTGGGGLDVVYTFDLLTCPLQASHIRALVEALEATIATGWMCWSMSNHDVVRAVTRLAPDGDPPEALRALLPQLLGALRGSICLYQGEELGLEEADLALADLRDPYGIAFWPVFKGRDGCRTPMPWHHRKRHAGFTTGTPWLPISAGHHARAVESQAGKPTSVLEQTRAFLHWRKSQHALVHGTIRFLDASGNVLLFERTSGSARFLCAFNLEAVPVSVRLDEAWMHAGCPVVQGRLRDRTLDLGGYQSFFGCAKL
jgi:alpha-glucosidase